MALVRAVHVLAMSLVVGGSVLCWAFLSRGDRDGRLVAEVTAGYEWLFWGCLGVLVATGVGNLGAFGRGLPGVSTRWGLTLAAKLSLVVVLLVFSLGRTLLVQQYRRAGPSAFADGERPLTAVYGLTAALLLALLALAEVLAHG